MLFRSDFCDNCVLTTQRQTFMQEIQLIASIPKKYWHIQFNPDDVTEIDSKPARDRQICRRMVRQISDLHTIAESSCTGDSEESINETKYYLYLLTKLGEHIDLSHVAATVYTKPLFENTADQQRIFSD